MTSQPMLSAQELSKLVDGASDAQLLRILELVERLERSPEIEGTIARIRSRLVALRPARPFTLRRLLTVPLEPLLVPHAEWVPGQRRISRAALPTLQTLALEAVPRDGKLACESTAGRRMEDARLLELGGELWPAAAAGLRGARLGGHDVLSRLGGAARLHLDQQIETAAVLLDEAPTLLAELWQLPPRPVVVTSPEERGRLERVLTAAAGKGGTCLQVVMEVLVQRTDNPVLVMQSLEACELRLPRDQRQGFIRRLATQCASYLQVRSRGAREAPLETAAETLASVIASVESLQTVGASGPVDRRALLEIRRDAGEVVEKRLDEALRRVVLEQASALATAVAPGDLESRARAAEKAARATSLLVHAGRRLGLGQWVESLLSETRDDYHKLAREVVQGLEARGLPRQERMLCLMDQVRLVEILYGSDAAMEILNEGLAGIEPEAAAV
ncbi:hypothetical protein SH611_05430 [Geminicoccaceae bacterium 1502E]|nr:hypothetical protein [Geminicoccaceae bacterium 1502E]